MRRSWTSGSDKSMGEILSLTMLLSLSHRLSASLRFANLKATGVKERKPMSEGSPRQLCENHSCDVTKDWLEAVLDLRSLAGFLFFTN